jgi:integrase
MADGSVKVFRYLRANNQPLVGEIGTPEFMASYAAAGAKLRQAPSEQFRSIIAKFKASAEWQGLADKTKKDYAYYVKLVEDEFGDMPLAALEDDKVRLVFLEWRDTFASKPRKADYAWTILGRILSWAKHRTLITANPCERGGRIYKGGDRAEIVWTPDDLKTLFASASPQVIAAVMLALWTGQREGDLLRMPWSSYDGQSIKVKQQKTGKKVLIPCTATLKSFLDRLSRESTTILVNTKGRSWTEDGFKTSFGKSKAKAEIVNRTFHDLRGTAVTRLALSGCSVPEIAAITGHSLKDVEVILEKHYLGGRLELAEAAALKLEIRFGDGTKPDQVLTTE